MELINPIIIHATGGRGDILCAEPSIRYSINNVFTTSNIIVIVTEFPVFFEHLAVDTRINVLPPAFVGNNLDLFEGYKVFTTYEHPTASKKGLLHANMHSVDYSSLQLLGWLIPELERYVQLKAPQPEEIEIVEAKFKHFGVDIRNTLLLHPGETWPSRTIPVEWWSSFLENYKGSTCVIGAIRPDNKPLELELEDTEKHGYMPGLLDLVDSCPSLANYLNMRELIVAIALSQGVLTNDSLPVHIAGAFNNWLFTFSTARRFTTLRPYRPHAKNFLRTENFATKCLFPPSHFNPIFTTGRYDLLPEGVTSILDVIVDAKTVAEKISKLLNDTLKINLFTS
jgi:hypothetical protein